MDAVVDRRLKIAIIAQGYTQRRVALDTRIGETRFSEIVRHEGSVPSHVEQRRIAKFLGGTREDYFSPDEIALADADAVKDDEARAV